MQQPLLKKILELSGQEWAVLLLVASWVMLRVSGLIRKANQKGKLCVVILGKEVIRIEDEENNITTQATEEYTTLKKDNLILSKEMEKPFSLKKSQQE
jgi:hypothetical protein